VFGERVVVDRVEVSVGGETLLAPVSFSLGAGEALAVRGPNGSGKTTLLRVLAGLTRPTNGTVTIAGHSVDERDRAFRARVAALIGLPPLARNLTLREHLALIAASWGFGIADSGERADGLLHDLGINRLSSRFPHELSSGQLQLFALALTLSRPFEVLLLDEPEQRLDPDRLELVGGLLRAVVDGGASVILASHSQDLVDRIADSTVNVAEAGHVGGS
jgi:ABC-2 type transport system ATP-binding protein